MAKNDIERIVMSDQKMEMSDGRELVIADVLDAIDSFAKNLSESSVDFIASMIDDPPESYSPKQIKWIKNLYERM